MRRTEMFLVTWHDGRNSQVSQENLDIYGQRFNLEHLQVFNNGLSATQIVLSDTGSNAPPFNISYDATDLAYRIEFSLGAYHYTYMIDQLTADNFSGYYHC